MFVYFLLWVGLARGGKRYDFFIGTTYPVSLTAPLGSSALLLDISDKGCGGCTGFPFITLFLFEKADRP